MRKLLVFFACALFSLTIPISPSQASTQNSTTDTMTGEKWREDLRQLATELPRVHKNLFHAMTPNEFNAAVRRLDERIPSLSRNQVIVEMARIVAMAGDGHTFIRLFPDPQVGFRLYPLKLYLYKDGLFVQAAGVEYASVVGARVLKIGNTPADEAYRMVRDLVPRDNEMGVKAAAPFLLTIPEVLNGVGIVDKVESGHYTVELNGKQTTIEVKPFPFEEIFGFLHGSASPKWVDVRNATRTPTPLWLKDRNNNYWFEYLPGSKTIYVQYNAVANKHDESVADFFKRVFAFVESNPVDRFVIDLRLNGGGNNGLNWPLIYGLIRSDKVNQRGKLFAIIGRQTFSAAQNCVNQLERHTQVTFVGEPTAGNPNHYGDPRRIVLPNSGITVMASTLWWQDMDPRDTRAWTAPSIATELTSENYRSNVDPAIEGIAKYGSERPINERLMEALQTNDIAAAIKAYREFKADPVHVYVNSEALINRLGYDLLGKNLIDQAIEVFKLNVESYPQSANVYDSLGEAYMKKGNKDLAIKNYEKTLELNPANPGARDALQALRH
jgi:tetratricopeptide (TPR) repeat protein